MKRRLVLSQAALALLSIHGSVWAQASGRAIEGVSFAGEVKVGDSRALLNGVGVRQVAWLKGYACGLYLPRATRVASEALAMPGAKRVSMRLLIDAPAEELAKAFTKGVNRNLSPADGPAYQDRIQRFDATIRRLGKLKKGDLVEVDWRPERGMVAVMNGRDVGEAVEGEALYIAMLKIYLGERPTDEAMKRGLLGLTKG